MDIFSGRCRQPLLLYKCMCMYTRWRLGEQHQCSWRCRRRPREKASFEDVDTEDECWNQDSGRQEPHGFTHAFNQGNEGIYPMQPELPLRRNVSVDATRVRRNSNFKRWRGVGRPCLGSPKPVVQRFCISIPPVKASRLCVLA
jgi:hypothetical protein